MYSIIRTRYKKRMNKKKNNNNNNVNRSNRRASTYPWEIIQMNRPTTPLNTHIHTHEYGVNALSHLRVARSRKY